MGPACGKYRRPARQQNEVTGESARRMASWLFDAKHRPEGSPEHRAAVQALALAVRPFVVATARRVAATLGGDAEDLEQLGMEAVLDAKAWRSFRPGERGEARTVFPAYCMSIARNAMRTAVKDGQLPIHVTRWGRRKAKQERAREAAQALPLTPEPSAPAPFTRGELEGVPILVLPPGPPPAPAPSAVPNAVAVSVELLAGAVNQVPAGDVHRPSRHSLNVVHSLLAAASGMAEETEARLDAHEALHETVAELPQAQRAALTLLFGLEGPGPLTVREVARELGLRVCEVKQAQAAALASLRMRLGAGRAECPAS